MPRGLQETTLTPAEKANWRVLFIEPDPEASAALRSALRRIGFAKISSLEDNKSIESWFLERNAKFLLFSDEDVSLSADKLVPRFVEVNEGSVPVVMSRKADLDQIFDLLALGARGCLLKPYEDANLEYTLGMAAKAKPFSPTMLSSQDRYGALIDLLANNIDRLSEAQRDAQQFKSAQREVAELMVAFRHSADMANLLSKNGEDKYLEAVERVMEKRALFPVTRLGRLRKRLARKRQK